MDSVDEHTLTGIHEGNSDALAPGTSLLNGQYVIDRYLSSGGFGITYHARDSLDRRVVIKECYPEALCRRKAKTVRARSSVNEMEFQSLVSMFVREARSIAKLNNPNIVGVHQVFEDNETAYMALDLIEGQDLLYVVENNRDILTPETIATLLKKLLTAVATVHAVDMLHRDISPDNILLDKWGNPVLIDFGAAREQASKRSRAISAMLVVKDGYSPQEFYISGSQQGPWSDLYSLAATFFHLICGEPPPNSQNRLAALASKRADPYPRLTETVEGFDSAFLRAIDKAMSVFPQDRIQSASDWLAMIETGRTASFRRPNAQKEAALTKVVASLVEEVGQELERQKVSDALEPQDRPDVPQVAVEKKLEYLLPEKPHPAVGPIANPEPQILWCDRLKKRDEARQRRLKARKRLRRGSVLLMACSVVFVIAEHPAGGLSDFSQPEFNHLIELGKYWTARTADMLTIQL